MIQTHGGFVHVYILEMQMVQAMVTFSILDNIHSPVLLFIIGKLLTYRISRGSRDLTCYSMGWGLSLM